MTTEAEKPKRNKRHAKAQKRENNQALLRYPVDMTAIVRGDSISLKSLPWCRW